jgi:methionyl-tRNA formyltransferase
MGSPEFAVPSLRRLAQEYSVVGVVTKPDRPAGRGKQLTPPPIKVLANDIGIPLIQPRRLSQPEALDQLIQWQPDLILVAAFGQILKPEVLELPGYGCLNVHASLLPRWRGAAPVQAAILNGDLVTGITIMIMDAGIDTGKLLSQALTPITYEDTAETLSARLAQMGADLLSSTLPGYFSGEIVPKPQSESQVTYAPMLKKEDGALDFTLPAEWLARQVRAFYPWPGTYMQWHNTRLKILRASVRIDAHFINGVPGSTTRYNKLPAILTSEGVLVLDLVQPAGKNPLAGADFLRGARDWENNPS